MAAALYWDSDDDLMLTGELAYETRGYRKVDGSQSGVNVTVCADPRTQRLMEQIRENETQQAIDRIRLIHNEEPKDVYILSNPHRYRCRPVAIVKTVENGGHIEQIVAGWSGEILPLSPKFLRETFPEHFKTDSATKHAAAEVLTSPNTIKGKIFKSPILARSFKIWEYRIKGTRGRNLKVIAPIGAHPIEVRFLLEKQHGNTIMIKASDERLSSSYRNLHRFRDLTPRVHQHQDYDFEYLDHLEFDPDVPGGWYVNLQQAA